MSSNVSSPSPEAARSVNAAARPFITLLPIRWITIDAYWAKGRTREVVERSFANSFPVGLYAPDGQQVAVAPIVSDRATFTWLCDVYVDPDHRGRSLATVLANWTCGVG
jgi:predicted GNAT family acetyltransferase